MNPLVDPSTRNTFLECNKPVTPLCWQELPAWVHGGGLLAIPLARPFLLDKPPLPGKDALFIHPRGTGMAPLVDVRRWSLKMGAGMREKSVWSGDLRPTETWFSILASRCNYLKAVTTPRAHIPPGPVSSVSMGHACGHRCFFEIPRDPLELLVLNISVVPSTSRRAGRTHSACRMIAWALKKFPSLEFLPCLCLEA